MQHTAADGRCLLVSVLVSKQCDTCIAVLAIQLAGVGFFASVGSTVICNYFSVSGASVGQSNSGGIWMVPQDNNTSTLLSCTAYPPGSPFDTHFWTSRVMSVLSPIFCLLGMVIGYMAEVGPPIKQECRLLTSIFFMVGASAMQGLTLMILESTVCTDNPFMPGDGNCGMNYGSKISIGAVAFMAAATFGLLVTGRKELEYDTSDPPAHDQSNRPSHHGEDDLNVENDNPSSALEDLSIRHGTGRYKFVDIWGKMI